MLTEITNEKSKELIIFMLNNYMFGSNIYSFVGQNFINLEKKNFFKLSKFDYIFYNKNTVKTRRAILFLFKNASGLGEQVIILKDFKIFKIEDMTVDDNYVNGSIFDVSFNLDTHEITIYDTFMICGHIKTHTTYNDRFNDCECFIHNVTHANIKLTETKDKAFEISDEEELFMVPNNIPLVNGINYSAFKWKPANLITFSLQTKEIGDDMEMYTTNFRQLKKFAKIHNSDQDGNDYINTIKSLENYKDECIIDINIEDGKIKILNVNNEKALPNNIRSIEKILLIKKENITFDDIVKLY